ncbi:hypothetical protein VNI00_016033 [Paramarasmius palmivorus]|uniref:Uncharacterized protein n=1 Tax=Paramarasmius palmivorus TaxID=297713 RepID=A0AAW0BGU9_9AGAR
MSPRRASVTAAVKAKASIIGLKSAKETIIAYPATQTGSSGLPEISKDEERDARVADFGWTAESLRDKAKISMLEKQIRELKEQLKGKEETIASLNNRVTELEDTAQQQIRYVNQIHSEIEVSKSESAGLRQTLDQINGRWREVASDNVRLLVENESMRLEISSLTRQAHDQEVELGELLLRAGHGNMARATPTIRFNLGHVHFVLAESLRKFRSATKIQLVRTIQSVICQIEGIQTSINRITMLSWAMFSFTPDLEHRLLTVLGSDRDDISTIKSQIDIQGEYTAFHIVNAAMDME